MASRQPSRTSSPSCDPDAVGRPVVAGRWFQASLPRRATAATRRNSAAAAAVPRSPVARPYRAGRAAARRATVARANASSAATSRRPIRTAVTAGRSTAAPNAGAPFTARTVPLRRPNGAPENARLAAPLARKAPLSAFLWAPSSRALPLHRRRGTPKGSPGVAAATTGGRARSWSQRCPRPRPGSRVVEPKSAGRGHSPLGAVMAFFASRVSHVAMTVGRV